MTHIQKLLDKYQAPYVPGEKRSNNYNNIQTRRQTTNTRPYKQPTPLHTQIKQRRKRISNQHINSIPKRPTIPPS